MRQHSRTMAICGLTAALALVLMSLGSAMMVMTYACPVLVGILLLCVREELGKKWSVTLWIAIGLLGLMLVPELEMVVLFIGVFGWYPSAKPFFDKLPKVPGLIVKLLCLNGATVLVYWILFRIMGIQDMPETLWMWVIMLVLFNVMFFFYDLMLERLCHTLVPRLRKLFPKH